MGIVAKATSPRAKHQYSQVAAISAAAFGFGFLQGHEGEVLVPHTQIPVEIAIGAVAGAASLTVMRKSAIAVAVSNASAAAYFHALGAHSGAKLRRKHI